MSDKKPPRGTGTPDGPDMGVSGVTRESANPGSTEGYGAQVRPGNERIEEEEAAEAVDLERRK
ncbi:MAG TPA: hypothetical protein VFA78_07135 [Chloroflexota bacterium]|nr:hypothetical protein [Chloroflexota bacterium]